jgi:hypothetical protein
MGSDFVEQYRKKSLLALLLLIFRGRAKYVTVALLMAAASLPFVAGSSLMSRIFGLPPVAAAFRMMGIGGSVSAPDPEDSGKFVNAAAMKLALSSYRNGALAGSGPARPCGAGCGNGSSLAMVLGNIYGNGDRGGRNRMPPGQITGALSASSAEGKTSVVDFGNMPPEGAGLYGGATGEGLKVRGAPYLGRSAFSGPAGTISRGDSLYSSAMRQASDSVPVPERPKRANSGKMGRVSGFGWDDTDYKTRSSAAEKRPGIRSPISQLADVFSVTNSAFGSANAEPEYQAGYSGAAYDGNDINLDILVAADKPLKGIEDGFVGNLTDMQQMQEQVKKCSDAQSDNGALMSSIGKEMDDMLGGMTNPPACNGNIDPWNANVGILHGSCIRFNTNQNKLATACQASSGDQMDCAVYENYMDNGGLKVKECRGDVAIILTVLLLPITLPLALGGVIPDIWIYREHR